MKKKVNKMTVTELEAAVKAALKSCPGSLYEKHLFERLKALKGEK